jgi:hypothetical protein
MYLKVHDGENGRVVAACDRELIGKVLEDGDRFLDLGAYKEFYVGDVSEEEEVRKTLSEFSSANLVGKKSVGIALSMGIADEEDVMYIKETPYIQIYKI